MNKKKFKNYTFFVSLFLIFILTSCNLPQKQEVPSEEDVATAVAQTLTAEPMLPYSTETLPPAQTQSPVEPSSTATDAPTPTETATPTTTPTNIPDDPADALGEPIWERTMVNGTAFGIGAEGYEDENTRIYMGNDVMVLQSTSTLGYRGWRLTSPTSPKYVPGSNFQHTVLFGERFIRDCFQSKRLQFRPGILLRDNLQWTIQFFTLGRQWHYYPDQLQIR